MLFIIVSVSTILLYKRMHNIFITIGNHSHYIPPLREGRKLDVLEKINCSDHETETCQGHV